MDTPIESKRKPLAKDRLPMAGFDVTCVIGHVDIDPYGEGMSPHEAAFLLIARHDTRGTFQFPMEDGRTMSVTVEYPDHES